VKGGAQAPTKEAVTVVPVEQPVPAKKKTPDQPLPKSEIVGKNVAPKEFAKEAPIKGRVTIEDNRPIKSVNYDSALQEELDNRYDSDAEYHETPEQPQPEVSPQRSHSPENPVRAHHAFTADDDNRPLTSLDVQKAIQEELERHYGEDLDLDDDIPVRLKDSLKDSLVEPKQLAKPVQNPQEIIQYAPPAHKAKLQDIPETDSEQAVDSIDLRGLNSRPISTQPQNPLEISDIPKDSLIISTQSANRAPLKPNLSKVRPPTSDPLVIQPTKSVYVQREFNPDDDSSLIQPSISQKNADET
jgi:hypothetical protein